MDRRQFIATTAGAATLAAPSLARAQAKPEITKLELGFGLDPVFAPHILAMRKGWLEAAGFTEVNTKSFTSGALAGEALVADQIHLWTPGNLPPISMVANGVPVVVLGTNCIATEADHLVARKDANIRKPEDLYNIKIGLLAGSTASAMLHNIAKRYNLDEKKLQAVNLPPPEQLAGLNSGSIQALLCWQPWGVNAVKGGGELIHTGTTSFLEANRGKPAQVSATRSLFVASQDFVRKNPNTVRALMAALVKGQKYAADPANKAEVVALVAKETKQDQALVEQIWGQYVFNPAVDDAYVADMRSMAEYLVASGRMKAVADPMDYTYTAPVAAADPALVKIPGKARIDAMAALGIALIGAGSIADYHLAGLKGLPDAAVRVVASRTLASARAAASRHGVPDATDDVTGVLSQRDIAAVVIATPDDTHEALAGAALKAGRAVLLQKPMTPTAAAARRLLALARETGTDLQVSWMHRHFPEIAAARALIAEGAIGTVTAVRLRNATPGPDWGDWFFRRDVVGGGVVAQLGVHGIDLIGHLFGEIATVSARTATLLPRRRLRDGRVVTVENPDTAHAVYEIPNGPLVHHEMSMIEPAGTDRFRMEIQGSEGVIWLRTERGPLAWTKAGAAAWTVPALPQEPLGRRHHGEWVESLLGRRPREDTARDGLKGLLVAQALACSAARSGVAVPVEPV